MSIEVLPLFSYALWLASAAIPTTVAYRSNTFYATDLALFVAPPFGFFVALGILNEQALTGWAFMLYPILILGLSVAAMHARVFLLPHLGVSARKASRGSLVATLAVAVALGMFVSPVYE